MHFLYWAMRVRGTVTASVASAYDASPTDFLKTTLAFGAVSSAQATG